VPERAAAAARSAVALTHRHTSDCREGCTRPGHTCPKRPCRNDCVGHADRRPKRHGGGLVFRQRKGRKKLTPYCPPELLARVVQEVLGHTRVTTTERYTHVAAAQVQDAGNRMAAALWGED
jgi:integrase